MGDSNSPRSGRPDTVREVSEQPTDRADLRRRVESALSGFLAEQRARLGEIDDSLAAVADAIDGLVLGAWQAAASGIRLLGLSRRRRRRRATRWSTAVAALELVQASALIHDDVMDQSDTRRGEPAVHRRFEQHHRDARWFGGPESFGESAAILIGDLCLVWSDEMFGESGVDPAALTRARPVFDRMRTEVMVGQYLDVLTQATGEMSVQRASKVARFKSAKYTVERPLLMGAAMAAAPPEIEAAYSAYGLALGEAFQLRDDVLGVFGDPAETGKPAGDDLREGKRTYLIASAYELADRNSAQIILDDLGDPKLDDDRIERLRGIIDACGARGRTEARIADLAAEARAALDSVHLDREAAEVLGELVGAATSRTR